MEEFNAEEIESYNSSSIKYPSNESLQLIEFNGNQYEVNKQALDIISSIEDEIIVVSIVGKGKTGKSFLVNLLCENTGSDNKTAATRGVRMWSCPKDKNGGKAKILFFDSDSIYDAKMFSLLFFISSLLINNTNSNIDNTGLSELAITTKLPNSILTNSNVDKDAFITESAPKFIWMIRDFNSTKVDPSTGKEISSKEYLDYYLRNKIANNSSEANSIRELIIKYFPDRDCTTLVQPIEGSDKRQLENNFFLEDLKPEFIQEFNFLKNKIFKDINSKKLKGKKFNGFALSVFIYEWVNIINQGVVPNINSLWDTLITKDINEYYEKALRNYTENISKLNGVMEQEKIVKSLYEYKLEAMMIYNKIFNFNQDTFNNSQYSSWYNEHKRKLEAEISKYEAKVVDHNLKESNNKCQEILIKGFEIIKDKMDNNYYNSKNCDEYLKDHETFLNFYLNNAKGPQKVKNIVEYLSETKSQFINTFVKDLEKENSVKLEEMVEAFSEAEKRKIEAEKKNRQLNEITQDNTEKIDNLNSDLEKKKRDIIDLSERIRLIEIDIRNRRESMQNGGNNKKAPF